MIKLLNIRKKFAQQTVLDGITINIEPGKTTSIIGASGSGKSTIFRILAGLETKESGSILFHEKEIPCFHPSKFGYVIQDGGLFPHLKAKENIELAAKLKGWSDSKRTQRVHELSQLVSLSSEALNKFPSQLSGGQKQRVALARGVFLDPEILLLDEPLGALDPIMRHDLQQELKEIFRTLQKTVILITHDLKEASFLSHTIHLLHQGKVLQTGTLADFCKNPVNHYVEDFTKAYMLEAVNH